MGTSFSLPIRPLPFPFPFSPESPPPRLSVKPRPQNPPSQLPLPFPCPSSLNPSTIPHHLFSNPLPKPPVSSRILIKTNPFSLIDSDVSVDAVICPSLAYANVYFYGPYNVQVVPLEDEDTFSTLTTQQQEILADRMVKRFRNAVANSGVFYEMKRRRFFENPREKKKTKAQHAAKVLKRLTQDSIFLKRHVVELVFLKW